MSWLIGVLSRVGRAKARGAVACAVVAVGLVLPSGAGAFTVQVSQGSFPVVGFGNKLAINRATGNIYLDSFLGGNSCALEQFDSSGNPLNFTALGSDSIKIPCGGNHEEVAVDDSGILAHQGNIYVTDGREEVLAFDSTGKPLGGNWPLQTGAQGVAVDSSGNVWASLGAIRQYTPAGIPTGLTLGHGGAGAIAIDPTTNDLYAYDEYFEGETLINGVFKYDASSNYASQSLFAPQMRTKNLSVDPTNGDVYITANGTEAGAVVIYVFHSSGGPSFNLIGVSNAGRPPETESVAIDANGDAYAFVHYTETPGHPAEFIVKIYKASTPPPATVNALNPAEVHTASATLTAFVVPGSTPENTALDHVTYHFEYVNNATYQEDLGSGDGFQHALVAPSPDLDAGASSRTVSQLVAGLDPDTVYDFRIVIESGGKTTVSGVHTLHTYATALAGADPCPNALARAQTSAGSLLDCRAYELVSAPYTGGYDVESDLVPGQEPFDSYPGAADPSRVLYAVHAGTIPGTGHPTNRGPDPYVATRTKDGWSTSYLGVPADNPFSASPFSSTPSGADGSLGTLAFGAPGGCSPCFEDGKAGIPVRLPDGELVQGMAGSEDPGSGAKADVLVQKRLSDNGKHLIFGSTSQFEPDATPGQPTIYDRDLSAGATQVISKLPGGENIPCIADCAGNDGVAELDISPDGSHVVLGQLISKDHGGNRYFHLYVNVGESAETVDLTPGTTSGALYDGMSADGSKVYFTTKDQLADDSDESADIYRADVSGQSVTLTRISTGTEGTGDSNSCEPAFDSQNEYWNSVGDEASCDAVAVGGGGGVAGKDGSIYFLSPELLDGSSNGVKDAPNLYLARPGSEPKYVSTLQSGLDGPPRSTTHHLRHTFGPFGTATGIAVEHSSGDTYVLDLAAGPSGTGAVRKLDPSGNPVKSFGNEGVLDGSNTPAGSFEEFSPVSLPTQLAVDQSSGDLYVPDLFRGVVDKFDSSGNYLGQLSAENFPSGVTVDPANGNVYVTELLANQVAVYDASGTPVSTFPVLASPHGLAVDSAGNAYVDSNNEAAVYDSSGAFVRQLDPNPSFGIAVDPSGEHVYVDEGEKVVVFDVSGSQVDTIGAGQLSGSIGLTIDSGGVYASSKSGAAVAVFGPSEPVPDPLTDNPLVLDSVNDSATRHYGDFGVTPSGEDAAFVSNLPSPGFENSRHAEVYRYHAPSDQLDCVSCNSSGAPAPGDSSLPSHGPGLTDDGRVFFNTLDQLVLADTNNKQDAYEWEKGTVRQISTATSPFDSSLLGVSANGTDAYFFTRDTLVSADNNGPLVKIYDARENGGDFVTPPALPCAASDECHGAGTVPAAPPQINSNSGSGGNVAAKKKHHRHHHHRRSHHKRAASHNRGGVK